MKLNRCTVIDNFTATLTTRVDAGSGVVVEEVIQTEMVVVGTGLVVLGAASVVVDVVLVVGAGVVVEVVG